jgi:hypothetical protein
VHARRCGGVQRKDTRLLISPGATGNPANIEVIDIFGVGGKREAVELGERVEIKTRYKKEKSLHTKLGCILPLITVWQQFESCRPGSKFSG